MNSPLNQNITNLQNLLDKVNALPEASTGVELPELSNPATATDLAEGMELIDSSGNIVTGTIPVVKNNLIFGTSVSDFSELKEVMDIVMVTSIPYQDFIIREGSTISVTIDKSEFGDATADDVVVDKTFTSTAGVKVTGTNPYKKDETDSEVATQTDLLAQAVAALDGKAAGGSGGTNVETCTVKINVTRGSSAFQKLNGYTCTTFVNGKHIPQYHQSTISDNNGMTRLSNVTLNDVVCGSIITLSLDGAWTWWAFSTDNAEILQFGHVGSSAYPQLLIQAPTESGAIATINCNYTD